MLRPLVDDKTQVGSQRRPQHASADWVAAEMHELASRLTRYVNWAKVNILGWIAAPSIMQALAILRDVYTDDNTGMYGSYSAEVGLCLTVLMVSSVRSG